MYFPQEVSILLKQTTLILEDTVGLAILQHPGHVNLQDSFTILKKWQYNHVGQDSILPVSEAESDE